MTWCNPICEGEEASHKLWTDDQTRKEIVESNEDARENLGRSHAGHAAHKGLTKVRIDGKVKGKNSL